MSVTRQIGGSSRGRAKTERQLSVVGFSPSTPVTDSPSSRLPGAYVARTVKSCQPATLDPVSGIMSVIKDQITALRRHNA